MVCVNSLPILVHHVPRNGLTRRPESPFKLTLDLAQVRAGLSLYDRIGSWNWLRLPPGTTTRQSKSSVLSDGRCLTNQMSLPGQHVFNNPILGSARSRGHVESICRSELLL